jgi:hypothetical protein
MEQRQGDAAQKAILEWVDYTAPAPAVEEAAPGTEAEEKPGTAARAPAARTAEAKV